MSKSAWARPVEEPTRRLKSTPIASTAEGTQRFFRLIGAIALATAIPSAIAGFAVDDPLALAISAGLMGCFFIAIDVARTRRGELSPMTLYAFSWTVTSIANVIAILNQNTPDRALFFIYALDEYLPLAMKISWFGLVLPVLGFHWLMKSPAWRSLTSLIPAVSGHIPRHRLLQVCIAAALLGIAANISGAFSSLGTLAAIVYLFPHLAAFTLARVGVKLRWRIAAWAGLVIALAEAGRALMFAYLRSEILSPVFAYAVGVLLGAGSMRALRSIYMAPVYVLAAPFIIYFAAFAEVRGTSGSGVERLQAVAEVRQIQEETQVHTRHSLLTRLSSINQLTQVGRVVEEDGYYNGATLEYLAYAWIPRFLWPEKPTIAKGAWFALRIGQARIYNGRITNSVNMTIPGELYLNFSWLGLIIGGLAFGGLLALFWTTTAFWSRSQNVLGAAFGFYLLSIGLGGGGADLQILVTLVAMYVVFATASVAFPTVATQQPTTRSRAGSAVGSGIS